MSDPAPAFIDPHHPLAHVESAATQVPSGVRPLFDTWMRDPFILAAPDGRYYLTGTTASAGRDSCWDTNDGIHLWVSEDLRRWEPLGRVWSFEGDATWQRASVPADDPHRAVWAPEIAWIGDTFYITATLNWKQGEGYENFGVTFLLRSASGGARGPYVNVGDGPMTRRIDSSLFVDDDGAVYYLWQNGRVARMRDDLSGLAETPRLAGQRHFHVEPNLEGVFVVKHGGRYHMLLAVWARENELGEVGYFRQGAGISYDCVVASADSIYGPYSDHYTAITAGGHNNLFVDHQGRWWSTLFGNPGTRRAPFFARPAILPVRWVGDRLYPDPQRADR